MSVPHSTEVYTAIYGDIYGGNGLGGVQPFNFDDKPDYRETPDKNDARNVLLNILDNTFKKLASLVPRPLGLTVTRVYNTNNNAARVVYTVTFNFKDTKTNTLVEDPSLDALSTFAPQD